MELLALIVLLFFVAALIADAVMVFAENRQVRTLREAWMYHRRRTAGYWLSWPASIGALALAIWVLL